MYCHQILLLQIYKFLQNQGAIHLYSGLYKNFWADWLRNKIWAIDQTGFLTYPVADFLVFFGSKKF